MRFLKAACTAAKSAACSGESASGGGASKATTSGLGYGGGYLGFGTLPGVAVALNTYPSSSVGIVTGQTASGLVYAAKTTKVPNLRSGTHVIGVTVTGSSIAVTVRGIHSDFR